MECQNCKKHKGTETWVGDGGTMAWVHGQYEMWCKCCVLKKQIKHTEELARGLSSLKEKLEKVTCEAI